MSLLIGIAIGLIAGIIAGVIEERKGNKPPARSDHDGRKAKEADE